jgi:hypothetical protein
MRLQMSDVHVPLAGLSGMFIVAVSNETGGLRL